MVANNPELLFSDAFRAFAASPTLTIDTDSDPGAWETAIAHTPRLARQCAPFLETYEAPALGDDDRSNVND